MLRQFLPEDLEWWHLLRFPITLEDGNLWNMLPFPGSLWNQLLWPCWKGRCLLLGSREGWGVMVCSEPGRSRTRCTASSWSSWQEKLNKSSNMCEKGQIIVFISHMEWEAARLRNLIKVMKQTCARAAQEDSSSPEGWSKVCTKKTFSSQGLCLLGSSSGWVRKVQAPP